MILAVTVVDEDMHPLRYGKKVKGEPPLDIVVGQGVVMPQLLTIKDYALLFWRHSFLVMNLSLNNVGNI